MFALQTQGCDRFLLYKRREVTVFCLTNRHSVFAIHAQGRDRLFLHKYRDVTVFSLQTQGRDRVLPYERRDVTEFFLYKLTFRTGFTKAGA